MESQPDPRGKEVTKNEIIDKTLKEIGPRLAGREGPHIEELDYEEIVIAELQEKLPDPDIKTCDDSHEAPSPLPSPGIPGEGI